MITVYDPVPGLPFSSYGAHSALYIEQNGKVRLYDPGGSYMAGMRGSNGVMYDGDASLSRYIAYHQSHGSHVEVDEAYVNDKDAKKLIDQLDVGNDAGGGNCAADISSKLSSLGEFSQMEWHRLPGGLRDQFRDLKNRR